MAVKKKWDFFLIYAYELRIFEIRLLESKLT